MALNVFELFGKIAIDSSGAEKGIKNTVNHAKDAEGKLTKTFKKIGTAVAAAFSVKAIVDFGKQCTEAYASIAAEESAFAQIMGDYADTANAKLKAVSDATGVSTTRMTSAMTSLTAKFKGLGYNVEDATTLATDGLLIATDAAAFWDMSLDESMSHLNSFINGSYEGGEAIGLFANDTQMAAYAVEQGIVKDAKAWAELSEAQKQATRLDYAKKMMAESGATGQAAKEADAYANVMANLKEGWRQFLGVVGKPVLEKFVLPAMQKLNDFLPKLTESVTNGIAWLEEGFDKIASYFTEVFTEDGLNMDALPNALKNMFRDLGRGVGSMLTSFGRTLQNGWNSTVWPMIQRVFKAVFGIELPDWVTVKQSISDGWNNIVWPAIQGFFTKAFGITLPSWADLKTNIVNGWNNTVWPAIKGFFTKPFSITLPSWEDLKTNITNGWNNTVWPAIQGFFTKMFGITMPSWEDLKTNITNGWNNTVWPAIKGFFTNPLDIVLPAWETLKTNIVNGWNDTVWPAIQNFFKNPFEVTLPSWEDLKAGIVNGWNNTVWPAIQGFFTKAFGITMPSWEDLKTNITNGWGNVVWPAIQGFFTKAFGITMPSWEDLKTNITNGWNNIVWPAIQGFFTKTFGITLPSWEDLKAGIVNGWNNTVWPAIQGFLTKPFGITLPSWEDLKTGIVNGWNNTVWPAIQGFLTKPFGITLPSWEDLKTGIVNGWNNTVWPAIKGFFSKAFEIALPVWENLKTGIVNGWNNTVVPALAGLFEAVFEVKPEDSDGTEVGAKIRAWWDLAVKAIGDIFKAVFGVSTEDEDGVTTGEKIKTWWNSVVTYIGNIFRGFFGVDTDDATSTGNRIISWFEGVLKLVGNIFGASFQLITSLFADDGVPWTDKIKAWWDSILAGIAEFMNVTFGLIAPSIQKAKDKLKAWWNSVLSGLGFTIPIGTSVHTSASGETHGGGGRRFGELEPVTNGTKPTLNTGGGAMGALLNDFGNDLLPYAIEGFATGLDYVPRDNFLARLHQGEAVLTRNEADAWRNGSGTAKLESALAQVADLLRDIARNTGADKSVVLDSGALVGQLAPGMNAYLGHRQRLNGRGNA